MLSMLSPLRNVRLSSAKETGSMSVPYIENLSTVGDFAMKWLSGAAARLKPPELFGSP